jgi:hypothetical protein
MLLANQKQHCRDPVLIGCRVGSRYNKPNLVIVIKSSYNMNSPASGMVCFITGTGICRYLYVFETSRWDF